MNILISAAGSAAAAGIILHLKKAGHFVIGIDANPDTKEFGLSICDDFYISPFATSDAYLGFITTLLEKADIFIPFIDEELLVLSAANLEHNILRKIMLCDKNTIAICCNKIKLQDYCEQNDIAIIQRTNTVPAVFKPAVGRGGKGVVFITDAALLPYYQPKNGVIQQMQPGTEYTVDVLVDCDGNWLFGVARKRLQAVGVSRIGEIDQHPAVLELAQQCVKKLKFIHAINIQIMLDNAGKAHLIEINPRLAGSVMFSVFAGFDLPLLAIQQFVQSPLQLPRDADIKKIKVVRYWQEFAFECNQ